MPDPDFRIQVRPAIHHDAVPEQLPIAIAIIYDTRRHWYKEPGVLSTTVNPVGRRIFPGHRNALVTFLVLDLKPESIAWPSARASGLVDFLLIILDVYDNKLWRTARPTPALDCGRISRKFHAVARATRQHSENKCEHHKPHSHRRRGLFHR